MLPPRYSTHNEIDGGLGKAGSEEGGAADPLKFGAEVGNCMQRLCRAGVKVMAMTTCLIR